MQILQRVSKGANDHEVFSSPKHWKAIRDKKAEGKDIITFRHHRAYQRPKGRRLGTKNLKLFIFICGKDIPKACIYRTLNYNKIGNMNRRKHFIHSVNKKREELSGGVGITERVDFSGHVGKKVWPITEESFSKSTKRNKECVNAETKDRIKGERKKPVSRMKELLRRVASTKEDKRETFYEQKLLKFRREGNIGAFYGKDERRESPKMSFMWDMETSSLHSLATWSENVQTKISHSHIYVPCKESGGITCRKENWITTDSEFVVLEL